MYPQKVTVPVTTAADGTATEYSTVIRGRIFSVQYVKTDFTNGVDFTITLESTGQGLWTESDVNAAAIRAPRQPTHDAVGAASLYAAAGEAVEDYIIAVDERVKIVIAQGGDTKSGSFVITYG